jgi:hypothetical protein
MGKPVIRVASASRLPLNIDRTCFCYITLRIFVLDKIVTLVGTIEPISSGIPDPLSRREFRLVKADNRWHRETEK